MSLRQSAHRVELVLLVAFIVFLPLFESPKNIFWLAYVVTWLVNRTRSRDFGGRWTYWDGVITAWLASGFVVAAFAGLHGSEWRAPLDIVRYGVILWAVMRAGYGNSELRMLLLAAVGATLIALGHSVWRLYIAHTNTVLQLYSVGHINHSAIYLGIAYGAALSAALAYWRSAGALFRGATVAASVILAAAVVMTASRAAVAVMLLFTVIIALLWWRRSRAATFAVLLAFAAAAVVIFGMDAAVVQKHRVVVDTFGVLNHREEIWNTSIMAWQHYPLFGVGMENYKEITRAMIDAWLREAGSPETYYEYMWPHAHSLYFNTLVERGLVGFAVVMLVLASWLYSLIVARPRADGGDDAWALWGASASAWFVTVAAGVVNTTLHHEHAILAVLLWGLWLAYDRQYRRFPTIIFGRARRAPDAIAAPAAAVPRSRRRG